MPPSSADQLQGPRPPDPRLRPSSPFRPRPHPERNAEAQHISVRHLYKVCEQNGISLEVWIIGQRLEAAKATLATGRGRQRTIATVAHAWGFANPSHFAKRFRASYGMTPTEWRTTSQL